MCKFRQGTVHHAYVWAIGLLVLSQVRRVRVMHPDAWLDIATWLTCPNKANLHGRNLRFWPAEPSDGRRSRYFLFDSRVAPGSEYP